MSNRNKLLALVTAVAAFGIAGSAQAQFNLPGLTSTDPSIVTCASINDQTERCSIPSDHTAVFIRQLSNADCIKGSSYSIGTDAISVTKGCRAEFRLVELAPLSGTALTNTLRSQILGELAARFRADYRLNSAPIIELRNDSQRQISSTDVGYSGEARVTMDNNTAKIVSFDSVYGTRSHDFSNLTYRVVQDTALPGSSSGVAFAQLLRNRLSVAMEEKLRQERRSTGMRPRFEVVSDTNRTISSSEVGYSGQGRAMLDGSHWQLVEFDSVFDLRNDVIRNLTYRFVDSADTGRTTGTQQGTSMDENNQRVLAAAIAAEVRRLKGGGNVQVVINNSYRESPVGSGVMHFRGKFGYSFNDEDWLTRGYDATMSLTQNKVQCRRRS